MFRAAPSEVALTFSGPVEPKFSRIVVLGAAGERVDGGAVEIGTTAKTIMVKLKPLVPERYTVTWFVTSVDTHKSEGSFSFILHG